MVSALHLNTNITSPHTFIHLCNIHHIIYYNIILLVSIGLEFFRFKIASQAFWSRYAIAILIGNLNRNLYFIASWNWIWLSTKGVTKVIKIDYKTASYNINTHSLTSTVSVVGIQYTIRVVRAQYPYWLQQWYTYNTNTTITIVNST